jgi:hypothetical protein
VAGVDPAGLEATAAAAKDLGAAVADVHPGLTATATATRQVTQDTDSMSGAFEQAKNLAGALGIGLSVGAVVAYGRAMIDTAGQIQKMADATGLTTDQVQGLMAAADQTSTPIAVFSGAIAALQQKLGSGDAGLIAATKALGLSFEDLRRLSPYEAMTTYASALQGVDDQNRQAALGVDVFGKAWRELGASVKAGALQVAEEAPKMTTGALAVLNQMDTKVKETSQYFKVLAADMIAFAAGEKTSAQMKLLADRAAEAAKALPTVTEPLRDMVQPLVDVGTESINLGLQQRLLAADVARNAIAVEQSTPAYKAWAAAMTELGTAGASWAETLQTIDGAVVEALRYYLQAGVQQGVLATAYGLTATQVRAVADALTAEKGANQAALAIGTQALEARRAEVLAMEAQVNGHNALVLSTMEADRSSRAYYAKLSDDARVAYAIAAEHADQYTSARIEQLKHESEAADATLEHWQQSAEAAMSSVKNAADQTSTAIRDVSTAADAAAYSSPFGPVPGMGGRLPAGAGGSVSAADADAYRPASYGAIGNVFIQPPTSLVGRFRTEAPVVNVQSGAVTMNYPIMNDPAALQQLGDTVGRAILSNVTRTGTPV